MKTRLHNTLGLGLVLAALPWVGACTQQDVDAPANLVTAAQAEPASANTNAPAPAATNAAAAELAAKPAPAPDADKLKLPENIKPSAALSEVIKLAQAGVDESVMLTYVTNSQNLFKLGADEIIYLKDIGVPDNVVTAMLERDHALQQALNEAAQAQTQAAAAQSQAAAAQAQQAASSTAAEAAAPSYVNPPAAQPAETAQQPNVTYNYNYFYNALAPYGSWIEVDGYGWCWRPTVVVIEHDWRPYCHGGRWLYTDLGWYWHSYYSWGWIAFHYGRWFHHPRWGWCWYPDYVWAPAWVTWRYSPGYCGWAPLPPAAWYRPGFGFYYHGHSVGIGFDFGISSTWFTFVSWNRFCDTRPWHHRLPHSRVTQIINNTTVVNNIITGDNNTIINRGVPVDFVRRHAGTEIRQVAVRTLTESKPAPRGRGEWLEEGGRALAVRRLALPETAAANVAPSPRQRDNVRAHPSPVETKGTTTLGSPSRTRLADSAPRRESGSPGIVPLRPVDRTEHRQRSPDTPLAGAEPGTPLVKPLRPETERPEIRTRSRETPVARSTAPTPKPSIENIAPSRSPAEPTRREQIDAGSRSGTRTAPLILCNEAPAPRAPATEARPRPTAPPATESPARENITPAPKSPSSSLVVIGRRDTERSGSRSVPESRAPTLARNESSRSTHFWTPRSSDQNQSTAPTPRSGLPRSTAPQPLGRPSSPSPRFERSEPSRLLTPSAPSAPRIERSESPWIQMSAPSAPSAPPTRTFSAPAPVSPAPRAPSVAPSYSAPNLGPAPSRPAPSFAPSPAAPSISRAPSTPSFSAPPAAPSGPSFDARSAGRGGGDGGRRVRDF